MKKIISLFKRDYEGTRQIYNEIVPGAEWVVAGEGVATIKFDGTCCLIRDGKLYKRYDHKPDNWKAIQRAIKYGGNIPSPVMSPTPPGFEPAQEPDPITLHWPGWVPVGDGNDDKWHREAWYAMTEGHEADEAIAAAFGDTADSLDGAYELVGPKVQGNPYILKAHHLWRHGALTYRDFNRVQSVEDAPRDFNGLKAWLTDNIIEGIVWHHPDGRMVKIKRRDFGLPWPEPEKHKEPELSETTHA